MKIAFEVQPLIYSEKTGIPWTAQMIIKTMMYLYPANDYSMLYFKVRDHQNIPANIYKLSKQSYNCKIKINRFLPYGIYRRIWHFINWDYSLFFKEKADLYHFFNFICPPRVKGKVVINVYDMVYKTFPETMSRANHIRLEKELARSCNQADAIITVSENSKKEIVKYLNIPAEKIYVIYNGVDLTVFNNYYSSSEVKRTLQKYSIPDRYFLYLGTLEPRKNITRIIEAYYRLIQKERYSIQPSLVIAGKKGWLYQDLFSKVKEYGLEDKVIFPGFIEDEDVPKLMQGASIFLFPSLYEGFGMPPLEAMACGTPVIVSSTSSLPEVVGDAGIMINPYNVEELCYWMGELMENTLLRKELIVKGLERVKNFTWERTTEQLMTIYKRLVEG